MGVRGLWKILEPTASPVKLDSLRGKILAIDASIWIYHFLKAMRDPKGTILTAAHIIGFFRRICKLMFFEIKPVFVFDGAAPIQKKQTTSKRSERRMGLEQNARTTANKLLTLQLQRAAANAAQNQQKQQQQQQQQQQSSTVEVVGKVPESAVYLDELQNRDEVMSNKRATSIGESNKPFVKMDQYHLPEIESIGPVRSDDQRLLTQDELDEYSKQFTTQARAGFIDTSLVDFHSREFTQLPLETQYQLLNMARLKSRLRMGYTAEELNRMFPNEMEFSKFQINRVAQRNFFTQRLMNLVGMEEDLTRRVSSEKNKEYYLKRTDQGWSLALEDENPEPSKKQPAKLAEEAELATQSHSDESEEDLEFEEVDLNTAEHENDAKNETVDLTAEESAKLDELFGFEANLSRRDLYSKLIDEVVEDNDATSRKPEKAQPRSSLFEKEEKPHKEEAQQPKAPSVPWFEKPNDDFEEMQIRQEVNDNFVSLEDYVEEPSDHDEVVVASPEASPVVTPEAKPEATPEAKPEATPEASPEASPEATTEVTSATTAGENFLQSAASPEQAPHDEGQKTASPSVPSAASPAALPDEPKSETRDSEKLQSTGKPKPGPSSILFGREDDENEPELLQVTEDLANPPELPSLKAEEPSQEVAPQSQKTTSSVQIKEPSPESEPRIELTADAAERAEDEAQADKEEDEDIAGMLIAEAEENERFARELAEKSHKGWTTEDQRDYDSQIKNLRKQFSQETRDADNITSEMIQECQELLQLFGIPYITAPTEAEAQCAELRQLKLVDGVVTDDGDTFLFDTNAMVYRNMFSQSKFVEFYSTKEIRHRLGLDRERLIDLAFLLGSDYTDGILGIGPVTGVEILAEFGDLKKFAEWWNTAQRFPESVEIDTSLKRRLVRQFKSKLFLAEDFPSQNIIDAYLHPAVDKDATKFDWGVPDLEGLRKFMASTAGWTVDKTNAALLPVVQETKRRDLLKKTEEAYDQTTIEDFYRTVVQNPEMNSKRATKAASAMRKRAKHNEG